MKISHPTNILIATMALLPASVVSKKDTPHRLFRVSRSKASKAEAAADAPVPPKFSADASAIAVDSKASKAGTSRSSKTGKAKSDKDELDLSDFDLALDFSMSTSMSHSMPMTSEELFKCTDCDDHWSLYRPYSDDTADHHEDRARNEHLKQMIVWIRELSYCAGVSVDEDSCLVANVLSFLPSPDHHTRMLRAVRSPISRAMQSLDGQCYVATNDEVKDVVDAAKYMCTAANQEVTDDEYNVALESFVAIFTNKECFCADLSQDNRDDQNLHDDDNWFSEEYLSELVLFFEKLADCSGVQLDVGSCLVANFLSSMLQTEISSEDDARYVLSAAADSCAESNIEAADHEYIDVLDNFVGIFANEECLFAVLGDFGFAQDDYWHTNDDDAYDDDDEWWSAQDDYWFPYEEDEWWQSEGQNSKAACDDQLACEPGSFCNYDFWSAGFCELCSDVQASGGCYFDGLPDRGAENCALSCNETVDASGSN